MQRQTEHIYRSFVRVFSSDVIIVAAVDVFSQRTPPSVPTIPERPSQVRATAGVHFAVAHLPQTSTTATNWPQPRAPLHSESKARGKILFVVMYMHVQEKYPRRRRHIPRPPPLGKKPTSKSPRHNFAVHHSWAEFPAGWGVPMRLRSRPSGRGHGQRTFFCLTDLLVLVLLASRTSSTSGWCVHLSARLRSRGLRTCLTSRFVSCRMGPWALPSWNSVRQH